MYVNLCILAKIFALWSKGLDVVLEKD